MLRVGMVEFAKMLPREQGAQQQQGGTQRAWVLFAMADQAAAAIAALHGSDLGGSRIEVSPWPKGGSSSVSL